MIRAALLSTFGAAGLAFAAGCGSVDLGPLADEPDLVAARAQGRPLPVRIAVAPPRLAIAAPGENAGAIEWPAGEIQTAAVEALRAAGIAGSVEPLPLDTPADEATARAWLARHDLVLDLKINRLEARYLGTNGWYWINLFAFLTHAWPAWLTADEDYDLRIEATATLTATATNAVVWSETIEGSVERSLDDFERGVILLAYLRLPGALGSENWRNVGEELRPQAVRNMQVGLGARLSTDLRKAVRAPAWREQTRQTLALVVGCGDYYARSLPQLKFPPADAQSVAGWMRDSGVSPRQMRVLTNDGATREAVLTQIRELLVKRARSGDRVVLYFSGLAGPDGNGGVALLPHDTDPAAPAATAITLADLAAALAPLTDNEVLVLADAGLGGGAGRWADCGLPQPARDAVAAQLEAFSDAPGRCLVWACGPGGEATESRHNRQGLLTTNWLRAVERARDRNHDGHLSATEALAVAREGVQAVSVLDGRFQDPKLFGAGDLVVPRPRAGGGSAAKGKSP